VRTEAELERLWHGSPPPPRGRGVVRLICVRTDDGVHERPERAEVSPELGLEGDRWSRGKRPDPAAQITLMNVRVAELVGAGLVPLDTPGDNFLVDLDLSEEALPAGSRLRIGGALIEVSAEPHTGCKKFQQRFGLEALLWVNRARERRLRGANCRVIAAGTVAIGDAVAITAR
jgi:MOSC domain-containing protein YiiM